MHRSSRLDHRNCITRQQANGLLYKIVSISFCKCERNWIVDSMKQTVMVYDMEHDSAPAIYSFADSIKVNIYDDLWIDFRKLDL